MVGLCILTMCEKLLSYHMIHCAPLKDSIHVSPNVQKMENKSKYELIGAIVLSLTFF